MDKYYHTSNCRRRIAANGITFSFTAYEHFGGSWYGYYTTAKPAEHAALESLTGNPASGVSEVTKEQYDAILKKKLTLPPRSQAIHPVLPAVLQPVRVAEVAGDVVEAPSSPPPTPGDGEPGQALPAVDDVVKLGKVPQVAQFLSTPKGKR